MPFTPPAPRPTIRLRSPFARAVVPVAAGILFFAALFGVTYLIAALISGKGEDVRLGDQEFQVGRADLVVQSIEANGPLLYADLKGTAGEQAIVLDHDPAFVDTEGWHLYFAYRADRGPSCLASIDEDTRQLVDCEGAPITVAELEPAEPDARVVIEMSKRPVVKVVFVAAQAPATDVSSTSVSGPSTTGAGG